MQQLQKAMLVAEYDAGLDFIEVQYNPTEFSLEKGAQIAEVAIPGIDAPVLQFVRGQTEKLTIELFFDTTEQGMGSGATSVTTLTDPVYSMVKIEPTRHAPPIVSFVWNTAFPGANLSSFSGNQGRNEFRGLVESVRQKFTLFSPEGVPLRATLTITLREYKTLDEQLHQLNLSSPDRTHGHVVQQGETLAAIARRYYGRAADWREIADGNGIEDPRRLRPGTVLAVPTLR